MNALLENRTSQMKSSVPVPSLFKIGVRGKVACREGSVMVGVKLIVFVSEELNISLISAKTTIKMSLEVNGSSVQLFPSSAYSKDLAETKVGKLNNYLPPSSRNKLEFFCHPL